MCYCPTLDHIVQMVGSSSNHGYSYVKHKKFTCDMPVEKNRRVLQGRGRNSGIACITKWPFCTCHSFMGFSYTVDCDCCAAYGRFTVERAASSILYSSGSSTNCVYSGVGG